MSGVGAPSIGETHLVLDLRDVLHSACLSLLRRLSIYLGIIPITNSCLLVDLIALFSRAFG